LASTAAEMLMGWRGFLRDMQAASRRAEREAHCQQRALEKQHQQYKRMLEVEQARHEVALYENQVEVLVSVHKECGLEWDWHALRSAQPPAVPALGDDHEQRARRALERYSPSIWDRLFRRTEAKLAALEDAVEKARRRDKQDYRQAVEDYKAAKADWEYSREFAARILRGDLDAYKEAIGETDPFGEIAVLGSSIEFRFPNSTVILADLQINGEKVIPSEIKSQLRSGKLSVKEMPKSRFYEIYQDYVCGCVLRVARELFALLPVQMVIVTALGEILNTQTGHLEERAVLSVAVPRDIVRRIKWDSVDPSDTIANFLHRMCFKKSKGLFAVEPIELSEIGVEQPSQKPEPPK
jgi:hypothetical protein